MIQLPIGKNREMIKIKITEGVFMPSVASTTLLFAIKNTDIKGKDIFEVGIGTGYIGIGLLKRGARYLFGTDINPIAVDLSIKNAKVNNAINKCKFKIGNFFEPFDSLKYKEKIDVIVSNPPLIPISLVRNEYGPDEALGSGTYRDECALQILEKSADFLKPDGILYMSIFSFSNPDRIKKFAQLRFIEVNVINTHDVIFDGIKLSQLDKFALINRLGKGNIIQKEGHPYWRIEILRCRGVKHILDITTLPLKDCTITESNSIVAIKRDWLGIVPLHYFIKGKKIIVSNTIKDLVRHNPHLIDKIHTVRSGCIERIDLVHKVITKKRYYIMPKKIISEDIKTASKRLRLFLEKNNSQNLSGATAVLLSGGIDSTIAAYLTKKLNPKVIAYTLTLENHYCDVLYAKKVADFLKIPLKVLTVKSKDILSSVRCAVFAAEDKRDYNIYSAVGSFLVGKALEKEGHKKVICGEGPDEIFGSYNQWGSHDILPEEAKKPETRRKFVQRLEWNLSRGVKVLEMFGIEVMSPYLTKEFIEYGVNLHQDIVNIHGHRKGILAEAFKDVIPIKMMLRPKKRFQDGSGITLVLKGNNINYDHINKVFDELFFGIRQ